MSAWGAGGSAKSCDALLKRVEQNDPTLMELVILSNKTFGPTEVERLSAALATGKNTNLMSLSASGHKLPPSSLERFGSAIAKKKSSLVRLAIGDKNMGDEGAVALCAGLGEGGGGLTEELDLEWKDLSTDGMAALGKTFGSSRSLQKLNLSRNERVQDAGVVAFCTSASTEQPPFSTLVELNLAECGVGPVSVEALTKLLADGDVECRSLSLILSGNPLGSDACRSLATLLCDSSHVSSLSLANCNIGNEGIQILSAAVTSGGSCASLTMLDLSNNNIGVEGAEALATSLWNGQACCWPQLVDLRLAKNNLSETKVTAIMNALTLKDDEPRNVTLQSLDLTQTNGGVQGAVAAVKCQSLSSLRLFNNKLGSEGFETLAPHLQGGHVSLVNLDLGGNDASEAAVVKLLTAIADRGDFVSTLRVLEIGGNQGGENVEAAVKRLKQVHPELDVARDRPKAQQNN